MRQIRKRRTWNKIDGMLKCPVMVATVGEGLLALGLQILGVKI
jgi:hypothetical protein